MIEDLEDYLGELGLDQQVINTIVGRIKKIKAAAYDRGYEDGQYDERCGCWKEQE